ncbi:Enhancer of polycomb-like transcription factor protein [Raphanus sativus]|uniref:Uncharacterized protein LOC108852000 isoform X3 n=1 Tax=Raphanus sativus TaxID=3726 RepID=A0A6J0N908_RAPSA|nr:uncharacterized protein LOC108852000 isoform X3 [Raphanus sativus]KAJ4917784.1 Enhancer of polycomb-like transcription factor protein [Raphanus sativus]
MALNPSRVLNDMDSDDEPFLARIHGYFDAENSASYEITEDMFEKASYVKQLDHLTLVEIQELMVGVRSLEPIWRTKRQSKRMPLIRHLQEGNDDDGDAWNVSGPTKADVGGNDREESPTIGTAAPSSSKVVKKA